MIELHVIELSVMQGAVLVSTVIWVVKKVIIEVFEAKREIHKIRIPDEK